MTEQTSQLYNTVALYNAKGGTGKTTVGINVAGALNQRGHDGLFVDLDPQGNATEGVGLDDRYDAEPPTLFDVITGQTDGVPPDLIDEHPEFDFLPSNVDMLDAEYRLSIQDYQGDDAVGYLRSALSQLDHDYDYILLDCPPFFGMVSDAGLNAARNVLVPALTESTSQRAVELLLGQIARLEREEQISIDEVGAVANRVESTNEAERMQKWLEAAFPDIPMFQVRKRVALQRAHRAGVSIFEHEESTDMEDVFLEIADTCERHFQGGRNG
jgi:chromosome partitioning protein